MFVFQTFPVAWSEYYHSHGLVMKDPAMHWAFSNTGYIHWRDLAEDDPHGVIRQARRHGLSHGFTVSFRAERTRSLGGFTRPDRDFLDVEIDEITAKIKAIHNETDGLDSISESDRRALKKLAIRLTHS